MTRPTLVDVAQAAGVSRATAARVLSGGTKVDARMSAAVLHAAEQLGYEANSAARMLRGGRAGAIGLVIAVDEPRQPHRHVLHLGAEGRREGAARRRPPARAAAGRPGRRRPDPPLPPLARGRRRGRDPPARDHAPRPDARGLPVPIGWVGRPRGALADDAIIVDSDNHGGGRLAARALADAGRRRLGIIAGPHDMEPARDRIRGWRDEPHRASGSSTAPSCTRSSRSRAARPPWPASSTGTPTSTASSPPPTSWPSARSACSRPPGAASPSTSRSWASTT
ncbi:LacI family DNA-binding transcriptional regulator [Clavibacter tessellarius]|uniref:LacI family DNA-binding transcriptional regulator n=1 Tax=Clavibacter tessellarius TaxID=31965 RepID=UPI0039BF44BD